MALMEEYDSDLDWVFDTDSSEEDQIKTKIKTGRPSYHSRYPEIVDCVKSFVEQSSAEAHLRRRTSVMYTNGVTLNDIRKHVIAVLGISVSRDTIHRLMKPPRRLTTASKLYKGLVNARVPPKRNTKEKKTCF